MKYPFSPTSRNPEAWYQILWAAFWGSWSFHLWLVCVNMVQTPQRKFADVYLAYDNTIPHLGFYPTDASAQVRPDISRRLTIYYK